MSDSDVANPSGNFCRSAKRTILASIIGISVLAMSSLSHSVAQSASGLFYTCTVKSEYRLNDEGLLQDTGWAEVYRELDRSNFTFDEASGLLRWPSVVDGALEFRITQRSSDIHSTLAILPNGGPNAVGRYPHLLEIRPWVNHEAKPFRWVNESRILTGTCEAQL